MHSLFPIASLEAIFVNSAKLVTRRVKLKHPISKSNGRKFKVPLSGKLYAA